jgi:peptidoglycan lytic transglycosylase G
VKPVLTARAYAKAAAAALPPRAFRRSLTRRSIEGFLFPSRYDFGPSTSASELVALQLGAFGREWAKVDLRRARARGLDAYDVLTVASMIERETVVPAERTLVSAVIYNRLDADMPLGIDATLRYGLGIPGTRPLTKANLASRSPYNTRRFKGLPPTPIGNPGLASLQAAAHPANVDYLYYVRKPDKLHHFFTADADEFCRKAREYGYGC